MRFSLSLRALWWRAQLECALTCHYDERPRSARFVNGDSGLNESEPCTCFSSNPADWSRRQPHTMRSLETPPNFAGDNCITLCEMTAGWWVLHYLKLLYSSGINKSGELCSNPVISEEHTRRGWSHAATVTSQASHKRSAFKFCAFSALLLALRGSTVLIQIYKHFYSNLSWLKQV